MNEEVMIRYKDVNGYPNRLCKVSKSEEEAREWFEREHPQCEIIEVRWRNEKMPKNKATLADRAVQAWKKEEEERNERRIGDTAKFAEDAKKRFVWVFKDEEIPTIYAIDQSTAKIVCEDVTFIAQRKEGGIVFLVNVKCQYCGKLFLPEYANNVNDLTTIGSRLSAPQTCEECLKERKNVMKFQSTAERVLEKVREIYDLIKEE